MTKKSKIEKNLRPDWLKAKRSSFVTQWGNKTAKQAMPTELHQETDEGGKQHAQKEIWVQQNRPWNRRHQIVQSVQEKLKERYGFLPDERRSAKKNCYLSWPLCKSGFTSANQLKLPFMI